MDLLNRQLCNQAWRRALEVFFVSSGIGLLGLSLREGGVLEIAASLSGIATGLVLLWESTRGLFLAVLVVSTGLSQLALAQSAVHRVSGLVILTGGLVLLLTALLAKRRTGN